MYYGSFLKISYHLQYAVFCLISYSSVSKDFQPTLLTSKASVSLLVGLYAVAIVVTSGKEKLVEKGPEGKPALIDAGTLNTASPLSNLSLTCER